jgi:Fe-S-cluster containining protein
VWVALDEIHRLAQHLALDVDEFGRNHLRRVGQRYALLDTNDGACLFLRGNRCGVYEARPKQCRSYPFWPANLASPQAWTEAADECEGISPEAPLVGVPCDLDPEDS